MDPKKSLFLLTLLSMLAACDSNQPSFSASNAQQPSAQQPAATAPAPGAPAAAPPPTAPPSTAPPAAADRPPPPAPPPSNKVAAANAAPNHMTQPVPSVESFGFASCDDYVARFRACMNTVLGRGVIPNERRFPLLRMVNGHVREWRAALAQDKSTNLASACEEADKEARPVLHQAGCTSF